MTGGLAAASVRPDSGGTLELATGAGRLSVALRAGGGSPVTLKRLRSPRAAVAGGAGWALRAAPLGVSVFVDVGASNRTVAWTLALPGRERLVTTRHGGVVVTAPARQTVPRATANERPVQNPVAGSASPLSDRIGGAPSVALSQMERVVAVATAPLVLDAGGQRVPARLRRTGDRVELAIDGGAQRSGPLVARIDWAPAGALGNGWFAYGASRALRTSSYAIEGMRIRGLGCATEEMGELAPGEEEVSRQLAVARDSCRSLVERGAP